MRNKMEKVNSIKVFVLVSILILSGLGISLNITGSLSHVGARGLSTAGVTDNDLGTRAARQVGPMVALVPDPTPLTWFVGQQDVLFDIDLESLYVDDDNDQNGNNVLYDVELTGTQASTEGANLNNLQRFNYQTHQFENVSQPIFDWINNIVAPNSTDKNESFLYTASGNQGTFKYVINTSNSFLDQNNNGNIDPDEYWAIMTGPKTYGDFNFNIKANAEPGYYRLKFKVSYKYQIYLNINTSGVGNGTSETMVDTDLFTGGEPLGPFRYYYWIPWDTSISPSGGIPIDLVDVFVNSTADFGYHKRLNWEELEDRDSNDWEAIPDDGISDPSAYPDHDNDGKTSWIPNYVNPAPPPTGAQIRTNLDDDFNARIIANYPSPPNVDRSGSNPNNGNGTWTYTGYMHPTDATIWGDPIVHTEDVFFNFIINSTVMPDEDLNDDNETNDLKLEATDGDYYTGSNFEEFFIKLANMDPIVEMRDVQAILYLPTDVLRGGFIIYKGRDTATVKTIDPFDGTNYTRMNYRLSIDPDTPPGYYYGFLELIYTKRFQTNDLDPLGNPLTVDVRVNEHHWLVQFMVDYTPDLGDVTVALPGLSVRAKPTTQIDIATSRQEFVFTVTNTGNVMLYGGDSTRGNLHLNFAEFKQMGTDYFDADADPGIDFEPIPIDTIDVSETLTTNISVYIPNHWYLQEGIYRLYLNFTGYYFDDGALGNSSGFVYMEMNWLGANDDNMPRDCYVMVDENGNETADDPEDSMRATAGMYTDIYINAFDPTTKELAIIDYMPKTLNQEDMMGGAYNFSTTFQNQQSFRMYNVDVEFDIEGYFDESYYYDWEYPTSRMNPKAHIDQLTPNEEWIVNFTVDDVDKLLPEGEHHIPVKYSYDYDEYQYVEERTTYSLVWDTSGSPFEPYIDANANFMLNKMGGTRAGGSTVMDIVFVVDDTYYSSNTYFTRLANAINDFMTALTSNNIDYQLGLVAFQEHSWLVQDLTTDGTLIQNGLTSLVRNTYNCGVYDAVMETLANTLTAGGVISYRPGATKIIILLTDLYPTQGTSNEMTFALACKGECILFTISETGNFGYYDDTIGATGGRAFNVNDGDYSPFMSAIAVDLGTYITGVTPTGVRIYDVRLRDVADPDAVDLDTYGPYLVVTVTDTAFDIDINMISSPIALGGDIRNVNAIFTLTNREYVKYADIEVELPTTANGETTPTFIDPLDPTGTNTSITGILSSTTLNPNGAVIQVTFIVDVNPNANPGVHKFDMVFRAMNDYTKQLVTGTIPVEIRVYPVEPILIIQYDNVKAKNVKAGDKFDLTFTIENVGGDDAREIYMTISNDWYDNDPFTTIGAFITAISQDETLNIEDSENVNIGELPQKAEIQLKDLGISDTSDIIDSERQLLAPTTVVPRIYIDRIDAGQTHTITIRMKADTHMVKGRPYREYILFEYIDSDGLEYRYDEASPDLSTEPIPIIIHTSKDDPWPGEEGIQSETLAVILIIIIIIIIILLFLGSIYQKRRMGEEGEPEREYKYKEPLEEEEEEELPPEEEEPIEEEEEPEEEKPEEEEWSLDEEEKEPEAEEPLEEEELEEKEEDDWALDEEEGGKKPDKGKMPEKGKKPVIKKGKGPEAKEEELEDW